MQLTGKLIELLPLQSGTGRNGTWKKQDVIIETDGQYPKKVCLSIWGDKIDENKLQVGNMLMLDFDAESREFSGKWYTDLKVWKIDVLSAVSAASPTTGNLPDFPSLEPEDDDVLPF